MFLTKGLDFNQLWSNWSLHVSVFELKFEVSPSFNFGHETGHFSSFSRRDYSSRYCLLGYFGSHAHTPCFSGHIYAQYSTLLKFMYCTNLLSSSGESWAYLRVFSPWLPLMIINKSVSKTRSITELAFSLAVKYISAMIDILLRQR